MGKVVFQLHAPKAKLVLLAGDFTQWESEAKRMSRKRGQNDVFSAAINLPPGVYEYKFVVDGEWTEDPSANEQRVNELGSRNSVIAE